MFYTLFPTGMYFINLLVEVALFLHQLHYWNGEQFYIEEMLLFFVILCILWILWVITCFYTCSQFVLPMRVACKKVLCVYMLDPVRLFCTSRFSIKLSQSSIWNPFKTWWFCPEVPFKKGTCSVFGECWKFRGFVYGPWTQLWARAGWWHKGHPVIENSKQYLLDTDGTWDLAILKGKDRTPTSNIKGRAVSFRECSGYGEALDLKEVVPQDPY